jgi:hypothetical protein
MVGLMIGEKGNADLGPANHTAPQLRPGGNKILEFRCLSA